MSDGLVDGRCWWGSSTPEYVALPRRGVGPARCATSRALFEKLSLEAFQSGLSWLTILRKRENFRAAFAGFEIERVAAFGDADVARLMADAGIVRNRAKIDATIANARAAPRSTSPLAELLWSFAPAAASAPADARRHPRLHARVDRDGEGAQAARLPLRRPDDRLRDDAGLRPGRRPHRRAAWSYGKSRGSASSSAPALIAVAAVRVAGEPERAAGRGCPGCRAASARACAS